MSFLNISKIFGFIALIYLSACQTKSLSPFEEAKNPYAHLGVEGYMGAAMTSCLGMAPQGSTHSEEERWCCSSFRRSLSRTS